MSPVSAVENRSIASVKPLTTVAEPEAGSFFPTS